MNIKMWIIVCTGLLINMPGSLPAITGTSAGKTSPQHVSGTSPAWMEAMLDLSSPSATPTPRDSRAPSFWLGEKFTYSIGWSKILSAGEATVKVDDIVDYQGHQVYKILVHAKSNAVVSLFYRNRVRLESLVDVEGLFSRWYKNYQHENNSKRERIYTFDQENNTALYKEKEYYIPFGVQDEVSAVFSIRTMDLRVGQPVYVDIFASEKTWRVKCNVTKTERLRVPAGTFDAIVVEPELHFDGVVKKGKVSVWFSNDERRIPLQVRSRITIGSILVRLKEFEVEHPKDTQAKHQ